MAIIKSVAVDRVDASLPVDLSQHSPISSSSIPNLENDPPLHVFSSNLARPNYTIGYPVLDE